MQVLCDCDGGMGAAVTGLAGRIGFTGRITLGDEDEAEAEAEASASSQAITSLLCGHLARGFGAGRAAGRAGRAEVVGEWWASGGRQRDVRRYAAGAGGAQQFRLPGPMARRSWGRG